MSNARDLLDTDVITSYFEANIDGFKGPIEASKFDGGQSNPTFKLTAPSGSYVLRRQPPGKLLKSAHAVDREYRVITALAGTDVPVPTTYHLCEDASVIGSMFYVMEFCDGRIFWGAALSELDTAVRKDYYTEMNRVLAAVHSVDLEANGLSDYGRPGNYFERQLNRWVTQYRAAETEEIASMNTLMAWLEANMPADDGKVALTHGDYRLDNMVFHPTEPRVIAVLDWELSTLGHPYADLAYQCMQLRMPESGAICGLMGKDLIELGIPGEEEYVAMYCERMGIDKIDNWGFYLAFSFFRLAAIIQGIVKRALDGNASNKNTSQFDGSVDLLAQLALSLIKED
jgi:aminoglycoside phosphotransferase (APT) family kinase protein